MAFPVFLNKALGIARHLLQKTVGTAAGTSVTTVGCDGFIIGAAAFQLQEFLGNTYVNGIPGEDFLFSIAPGGVEILFDPTFPECIVPFG